jgi:adenylylsulfate kinase-like enzyme
MRRGFTVWVTGPDARAVGAVVAELRTRLAGRQVPVETIDEDTPGVRGVAAESLAVAVVPAASLLARHGIATIVALPGSRAARDGARAQLGRELIEVHVSGAGAGYEPPERPEVEISAAESASPDAVDRVMRTLEVLRLLERDQQAYSADEEREVIRRLKAFGYL